jgi:perosamine synthetase
MSSTRLPRKVLADLGGMTLLDRVIARVRATPSVSDVVVATTVEPDDDELAAYVQRGDTGVFRGDRDDVLDRFYQCARKEAAEIIVRITADDPLKDPEIIERAIRHLLDDPALDYCSNTVEPSFPEGLDVEVFRFATLDRAWREARLPSEREHVTPYVWKHPQLFKIHNFGHDRDLSSWRWTVDKQSDLDFVRAVFDHFAARPLVGYREIIAWLERNPQIRAINSDTVRNEGYLKSLQSEQNMNTKLPPAARRLFGNELKYVTEVLETEFRSSRGSMMMRRLEDAFAKRFGGKYAISFVNGTATMHAALEAWGIGPGDEVIVPPLTMSATTFAVLQASATPVFADVDPDTFQISAASIAERITPRTRAIITVALYGLSPDMDPIRALATRHGIKLLEDDAQCFLGTYKGRLVGTLGDCSSFSFQSSKHMTSGEGGMILTDDLELAESVRKVQSLGYAGVSATKGKITKKDIQDPNYSRHVTVGWNYRMPELCCAVALAQLENLDALVEARVAAARQFQAAVAEFSWFKPQHTPDDCTNSYWTWVAKLDRDDISWHQVRDRFLENGGDGVYAAWKLTYLEPMFQNLNLLRRERQISTDNIARYKPGLCPVAERLQPRLMQFKTNYWDVAQAARQADILRRTLASFGKG